MSTVFVNYRTGDGDEVAALLEHELSARFGSEQVFRASKSIPAGSRFPQALITAARRSHVLLAVIGRRWFDPRTPGGRPAVEDPDDWTRREIIEAFETGALVIPVLVDSVRIDRSLLPLELSDLADCQYRRLSMRNSHADLDRIGDDLSRLVPALAKADTRALLAGGAKEKKEKREGGTSIRTRDGLGQVGRDLSGTVITAPRGPVHTGSGTQHNGPQFNGDGMGVQYVDGGRVREIRQQVGRPAGPEDGQDR
ncbi:toll/interleukin-1 receptor domain-containing protein [Kitasatospora cineracea]|uniref:toll/interleukin-1 receptor domain-containing protein n=1 Tax=Kitasatospora cineracea TaxID=88074 RepID=UPI0037F1682B